MKIIVIAGLLVTAAGPAFADDKAFFEADVGMAIPVAGDEYNDNVDSSFKFGLRLGKGTKFGGVDIGFDYTPYNDNVTPAFTDVDVQRFRIQVGARINHQINKKTTLYARFAGGVDIIHYSAHATILGMNFDNSETDFGIAVEASLGVLFDLGKVKLGAKIGMPMAFHFNGDDPMDNNDADLEYNALDIDIAFVIQIPF